MLKPLTVHICDAGTLLVIALIVIESLPVLARPLASVALAVVSTMLIELTATDELFEVAQTNGVAPAATVAPTSRGVVWPVIENDVKVGVVVLLLGVLQ